MNLLKKLFNLPPKGFPQYYYNKWYNSEVYSKDSYPKVFNTEGRYIDCKIGVEVKMGVTSDGKDVMYKVTKIHYQRGSDYLYSSDGTYCNLKFSYVKQ